MGADFHPSERAPDVVAFECPRCGAELFAAPPAGAVVSPPTCHFGHAATEMEQRYLGADAYQGEHDA